MAIDLEAGKEVTGKHGEKVKIDKAISDVDASDFDALLIPGGFSPDLLRADDRPGEFARELDGNHKRYRKTRKRIPHYCFQSTQQQPLHQRTYEEKY